jgi:hypothetical protein
MMKPRERQTELDEPRGEPVEAEQPSGEAATHSGVWIGLCVFLFFTLIPIAASAGLTAGEVVAWVFLVGIFVSIYAVYVKVVRKRYRAEPKTRPLAWMRPDFDDVPPSRLSND